jgi:hypothetical protein
VSITIVAPTYPRINQHAVAIERTASVLPHPAQKLLIAPAAPTVPFGGQWRAVPDWMPGGKWEMQDFCRFLLTGLARHIDTDFALLVQWDGYGIKPEYWTDDFLDYDYIGAPWPPDGEQRVGNGGFSLRSKKWLECGLTAPGYQGEPEDVFCCRKHLKHYLDNGCKVAPLELALRFSTEGRCPEHGTWPQVESFGFHKYELQAGRPDYTIPE